MHGGWQGDGAHLGDAERMNAHVEEALCLLEQRSREDNNTGSAVANLVVL